MGRLPEAPLKDRRHPPRRRRSYWDCAATLGDFRARCQTGPQYRHAAWAVELRAEGADDEREPRAEHLAQRAPVGLALPAQQQRQLAADGEEDMRAIAEGPAPGGRNDMIKAWGLGKNLTCSRACIPAMAMHCGVDAGQMPQEKETLEDKDSHNDQSSNRWGSATSLIVSCAYDNARQPHARSKRRLKEERFRQSGNPVAARTLRNRIGTTCTWLRSGSVSARLSLLRF